MMLPSLTHLSSYPRQPPPPAHHVKNCRPLWPPAQCGPQQELERQTVVAVVGSVVHCELVEDASGFFLVCAESSNVQLSRFESSKCSFESSIFFQQEQSSTTPRESGGIKN